MNPELKITVARQCELLSVERSGLYYKPVPKVDDTVMMNRIYDIWYQSPCFGYRRVTKVLRREGMRVNRKKVKRLMNLMGLKAIFPGPKTSLKGENHKIYDCLLDGLHIVRPNQVWQVDITYIRTRKGFAYLTALIDVYSRYIVGWALSNTMEVSFCLEALNQALEQGQPEIINSDQGRQFTGNGWINTLKNRKIKISMTGKGRCNKFAQNSIYLSSQQATRYFGKLPLRVVMRFVFFRSKLRGIRPLAIDRYKPDKRYYCNNLQPPSVR
ncbi:IS3 family transposase [Piscirickettsia salmonis]|uniref:IS3 family transposase n=1 Tax=Piscirickettsia salmonis TaxID=1238 RepID=UPI001E59DC66|nr:IS3 family transposase [Piscirickettsia salmonis]